MPTSLSSRAGAATAAALLALASLWAVGPTDPASADTAAPSARVMENLGRGVVAVRSSSTQVLVSWRLLGLDPEGIGFNVYRSTAGGAYTRLNAGVLTGGTNYTDATADLTRSNSYRVTPVVGGQEQTPSSAFTLTANHATEPVVRVPLRSGGPVKFAWVGDLDGDGAYDYVIDRQTSPQTLEAYRGDGTFLWQVNLGPNSQNQDNIEPGSSTVDVGNWDGVTVYDFDSDGDAEVALKIADGVTFGDGTTWTHADDSRQWMAVLDGRTGALSRYSSIPTTYLSDGPLAARLGVAYLDGTTPSLVAFMKNRQDGGAFNLMIGAWKYDGASLDRQWTWQRGSQDAPDGHNTRAIDVNGDGTDEIAEIGFVLNGDGTLRYSMGPKGIVHGDRFHIADMDPSRPGLEGYGVQQDNPSGLLEYYYDASTGALIWQHYGGPADVGRGMAADIDSRYPGMEVWSFSGLYNARTDALTEPDTAKRPWPQLGLWWDGDLTAELLNDGKIEKWDPLNPTSTGSVPRLVSTWNYGAVDASQGINPLFVGDILGDWREEAMYTDSTYDELIIFTTNRPTTTRLYTLAHNPAYRNAMTFKGYMQSHQVDYFLGSGMSTPPRPHITYAP
ncbi:hypothetical protein ACIHIX_32565 [Streptomyces sp. NPDC051913]|uniref:rhamnogalacturonan lyase family protein n=1 Tax=Streptomyces sp. NPDC051913 TaxID=3365676 RepID=UPI0037D00374